jgi:hypothetical protein
MPVVRFAEGIHRLEDVMKLGGHLDAFHRSKPAMAGGADEAI